MVKKNNDSGKTLYAKNKNIFCIFFLFLLFLSGCQLPLANYFRDQVFPQDTAAKISLSPLLLPAYAILSVTDVTIINPVRGCENVPSVFKSIWQWQNEKPWLGSFALIPFKIIAIPPAAIGTAIFSEQFIYNKEKK